MAQRAGTCRGDVFIVELLRHRSREHPATTSSHRQFLTTNVTKDLLGTLWKDIQYHE